MTRSRRWLVAALLVAAPSGTRAAPLPTLLLTFEQPATVHVNARAPSTVTVTSGRYTRQVTLTGQPDPLDPEGNYGHLDDARLPLPVRAGATVTVTARLYVCDGTAGVCRVEEHHRTLRVAAGVNSVVVKVGVGVPRNYLSPRT